VAEFIIHPEINAAIKAGQPIVALESAVVTAGLPGEPHNLAPVARVPDWNADAPANIELARAMSRAVRDNHAVPALTAVLDGDLHIGLPESRLDELVRKAQGRKATTRDFAVLAIQRASAGTTVAGTLRACTLLRNTPIRVLATGGIGGIHHTWPQRPDISADLAELARSPICVVCSGAKSVLDLHATMEWLESLSVPVIGFGTSALPAFYLREYDGLQCQARLDTPTDVASMCWSHWGVFQSSTGVLVTQPVHKDVALEQAQLEAAMREAREVMSSLRTAGSDVTPLLLREVARRTAGRSLDANISLLVANARLAGQIASACHARLS